MEKSRSCWVRAASSLMKRLSSSVFISLYMVKVSTAKTIAMTSVVESENCGKKRRMKSSSGRTMLMKSREEKIAASR